MLMGHCHLFPGGRGECRRDEFGIPGTSEHLNRFMKACGFDQANVLAPHEGPEALNVEARIEGDQDGLEWLLKQPFVGVEETSVFLPGAAIRPDLPNAEEKLARAIAAGVHVLKFHPLIMRSNPLDASCEPFFRKAAKARMPMVYHTGGGDWGWPTDHGRVGVCAELAGRYPGLPLLMAHCGVFGGVDEFEQAVSACESHPSLFLDATHAMLNVGKERWHWALERIGAGRVVYGNDYPWATVDSVSREVEFIESLGLSAEEHACILGDNLRALYLRARSAH
jgi:predicted TIM-barrel fold metal-dependent hydrolase